eukprot:TRINITY_DN1557_c0_g1_i4.p1 TRINITY_DN1557_c0_g1~~TRINITY_DN1557_c0_g1_i4.p1  ORF type:complete len:346 (-),score=28.98 TRINITY_DN1557_c0_g1_i4:34-1071(-)
MLNLTTDILQATPTELSTHEKRAIWIIFLTSNSLSLLGSLFILASMMCFSSMLKKLPSRLILYLTICSLLSCIGSLISFYQFQMKALGIPCLVQAVIIQVFGVGTFLWIVVIAFNLYMVVVHHVLSMNKFEKYYHIFCWGICFSLSFLPVITGSYGPVEGQLWCWISVEKNVLWGHMWRFVCFFLPLYICLGIIVVLYARVYYAIKSIVQSDESEVSGRILRKLKAYPLVFLLVWILPTINRIFNWVAQDVAFVLLLLSVLTSPLEGFLNALVYGLHTDLRNKFKQVLLRKGCCVWFSLKDDSNHNEEEELVYTEDDNDPSVLNATSISYGTPESESKRRNNDYD